MEVASGLRLASIEFDFEQLLGRRVDLRPRDDLSECFRAAVTEEARPLYMAQPDDIVRLRHLRDAAEKAIAYTQGNGRRDLEDDELLRLAVTKLVEIVGEAAIPDDKSRKGPEVSQSVGQTGGALAPLTIVTVSR